MRKWSKFFFGLCLVAAFGVVGVFMTQAVVVRDDEASAGQEQERQPTRVGVASPEMRRMADTVSAVGTLRPFRAVEIAPDVAGRVTDVLVTSGQQVSAGDLLIQLDDRAARAALAEADASLREAEQEYDRYQRLEDSNAAAEARLEEARGAFRHAEAVRMMAKVALDDRSVTAPFAGALGVIDIDSGAFIRSGAPLTCLSDLSAVQVSVSLPERYFGRVVPGQTLEITTPAYPDETFEAQVTVRAPEIDMSTRSFEIRAEIDNADNRLVGGMFANSRLVLETYDGMAIPDDAIISEGLSSYVYAVIDGSAARIEVEVGASLGGLTEVRSGLDPEARVVVAGWDQLTDGAPVEIDDDFAQEGLE